MSKNSDLNDEIDLRRLFLNLWHGKIYIFLIILVSVFFAASNLRKAERLYAVEYSLKPVGEIKNSPSLSGLSGIASLAGIQLPTSSNNDFNIFKELITSSEVSEIIFENKKIIRDIFRSEWDETFNKYPNFTFWWSCIIIKCFIPFKSKNISNDFFIFKDYF